MCVRCQLCELCKFNWALYKKYLNESIVRLSLTVYRGQHLAGVEDVVRVQQSLDAPHQPYERLALGHMQELRLHHTWLWLWLGLGLG